ncbi:MAG: tRNA 2-selenouridine(34) synthase MnmH [Bacteroidia bacterium]|nr:tRNA 2-selenouridine(34) synthase MnmH [Bacteroidia bacterium]
MTAPSLSVADFIQAIRHQLIIDVRAPIEFFKGHIPLAINIPLFDDLERAEVGTIFKQRGRELAISRGKEIVSPKTDKFIEQVYQLSKNKKVFVYCFRGGMRSNSFAWLLNSVGLQAVVLNGGYKAYRNYVLNYFNQSFPVVLLGGKTGCGKTDILKELAQQHIQTIDLEYHAHHKGSAFGTIHQKSQNPQQIFEHHVFCEMYSLNQTEATLIEDESQTIGFNKIPFGLWQNMKAAPIIKIEVPFEARIHKLVEEYGNVERDVLKKSVLKISQQLGTLNTKKCLELIDNNCLYDVVKMALTYYDKTYEFNYQNKQQTIITLHCDDTNVITNSQKVKQIFQTLSHHVS